MTADETIIQTLWEMMDDAERRQFVSDSFAEAHVGEVVYRYRRPIVGWSDDWRRVTCSDGY